MASWIPKNQEQDLDRSIEESSDIYKARVMAIDDTDHAIKVEPITQFGDGGPQRPVKVLSQIAGDIGLPQPGTTVIVAETPEGMDVCLGFLYTTDELDHENELDERIISHNGSDSEVHVQSSGEVAVKHDSGSSITLNQDGSIDIDADGNNVTIGNVDGSTKPVARDGDAVTDGSGNTVGTVDASSDDVETT